MRHSLIRGAAAAALLIILAVLTGPFLAAQTAKIEIPYSKHDVYIKQMASADDSSE